MSAIIRNKTLKAISIIGVKIIFACVLVYLLFLSLSVGKVIADTFWSWASNKAETLSETIALLLFGVWITLATLVISIVYTCRSLMGWCTEPQPECELSS